VPGGLPILQASLRTLPLAVNCSACRPFALKKQWFWSDFSSLGVKNPKKTGSKRCVAAGFSGLSGAPACGLVVGVGTIGP
jgi:hypothetical protein